MKYCAKIAYDGTNYQGFQIQPNADTIQARIEWSLGVIYKQFMRINYAGRTDSGVNAMSQYIDFSVQSDINMEPASLKKAMNSLLPKDIRIMNVFCVADDFHSRYSAVYRDYTYFIYNSPYPNPFFYRYSWHIPYPLSINDMKSAKYIFEGLKDFGFVANESEEKDCTRDVHFIHIRRFRKLIIIHIRSNGFLRGMVRNIVGILVAFSKNTLKIKIGDNILRQRSRLKSFKAPANGLFLTNVNYQGEQDDNKRRYKKGC